MDATTSSPGYLKRYEEADDGLRFRPGLTMEKAGIEVPDGILGDKTMRAQMTTDLLTSPISLADVKRPQFTLDELNDVVSYFSWNIWDQLMLRATEGKGLVPRQEYEALSFVNAFYRWPEFQNEMVDRLGGYEGIYELGRSGAQGPADKINLLHAWCLTAPFLNGRAILLMLDQIQPTDYLVEMNTNLKFYQALATGYRGDGYWFASQQRYTCRTLPDEWVARMVESNKEFDGPAGEQFNALMAASELLSFYVHFDCRLGLDDRGPWIQENGNPMIVRSVFLREEAYSWSMLCDDQLPYALTFAFEIDAEKMGLEEVRVTDIGTLWTSPSDYLSHIVKGSVYIREEWDSEVEEISIEEAYKRCYTPATESVMRLYEWYTREPRRHMVENGAFVYYAGMFLPFMRKAGMYDEFCARFNFWEFDQRAANIYYDLYRNDFARVVIGTKLFSGELGAWAPIPQGTGLWRSKSAHIPPMD